MDTSNADQEGGLGERRDGRGVDHPHEVDGLCSRCSGRWPCLRCLTMTPPYVQVWNNV